MAGGWGLAAGGGWVAGGRRLEAWLEAVAGGRSGRWLEAGGGRWLGGSAPELERLLSIRTSSLCNQIQYPPQPCSNY